MNALVLVIPVLVIVYLVYVQLKWENSRGMNKPDRKVRIEIERGEDIL